MNIVLLYCLVISFLIASRTVGATCGVIPIEQWGGSSSNHVEDLARPVNLVVVTHTVTGECDTEEECVRIANAIRNTQKGQGFNDIGLSFLVGGNGKIYEGAGWKVGSHTRGFNEESVSLSFIGDYRNVIPSKEALEAAENFLSCFQSAQYLGNNYKVVGHRQLIATISPGDALQRIIQAWPHWSLNVNTRPH